MSGSTHVFIVCSPRPRTGKTLVARLLSEFYLSNAKAVGQSESKPVVGYDLSPYEPGLSAFLPAITTQSSLDDTNGQIALFDQLVLDDDRAKVVDLSHMVLEKFFTLAFDIGFDEEARSVVSLRSYFTSPIPRLLRFAPTRFCARNCPR